MVKNYRNVVTRNRHNTDKIIRPKKNQLMNIQFSAFLLEYFYGNSVCSSCFSISTVLFKISLDSQRVDPGYDLKQRTIASVMRVKKQLQHESRTRYSRVLCSQLQKGNLKTLGRPMTASGPQMRSCQGIVAGEQLA